MITVKETVNVTVKLEAIPKPRMSRSDRWKERPCVIRYRNWADAVRKACTGDETKKLDPLNYDYMYLIFKLPIPPSKSNKDREMLYGQHHRVRPDLDNLIKGVMDAIFENDGAVCTIHAEKFYVNKGDEPSVDISLLTESSLEGTT